MLVRLLEFTACSAIQGGCRMTLIVTTVVTVLLISTSMAVQQTFLDEPWDVTVVAGDKVRIAE